MTAKELREFTPDQLRERVLELRAELANVRAGVLAGSEKNHGRIKVLRRETARTLQALQAALH